MVRKLSMIVVVLLLFGAGLYASGQTEGEAKVVEWRFPSLESGPGYWSANAIVDFSEAVAKRTNGRLKVNVYYGGELGITPRDFLPALKQGAIQGGHGSTAYYVKEIEGCAISAMPMVAVGSYEETVNLHKGLREFINKQLEEKYNVQVLWIIPWEFVQPLTNKKIEDFTNLNGMKLRVSGVLTGELIKACNGVPVTMPLSEVYTSLSKKVIDGAVTSIPELEHGSLHEVTRYVHNFYYHSAASIYLVSLDALNALPNDVRKVVLEEAARVEAAGVQTASRGMAEGIAFAKSKPNLQVLDPAAQQVAAVRAMAKPLWDNWYQNASPEARQQFVDALARTGVTYVP